jgi:hypothetical protein
VICFCNNKPFYFSFSSIFSVLFLLDLAFGVFEEGELVKTRRKMILLSAVWVIFLVGTLVVLGEVDTRLTMHPVSHTIISVGWAGYIIASSFNEQQQVVGISATWIVPRINASAEGGYSSAWIGIGGQTDKTLIQIGTEHNLINGQERYHIWYEVLPEFATRIPNFSISPGDIVTASISLLNNETNLWNVLLIDGSTGETFSKNVVYNSTRTSGEWIVERSFVNKQISNLPDFSSIKFVNCNIDLGDDEGVIGNFTYSKVDMTNEGLTTLASATSLEADGSSFTVNYHNNS